MTPRAREILEAIQPLRFRLLEGEQLAPWSTAEAAAFLKVRPRTIRRWVKDGKLEPIGRTPGGHLRFDPADVEALLRRPERVPDDLARAIVRKTRKA